MSPLFSNLALERKTLKHNPGNVLTSAALIAGTTIGAGILALPAVTLPAGVIPSTLVLVLVWLYMLLSGLLIAEANLQVMQETGRPDVGLLATIQSRLGQSGVVIAGALYIFIHYALLVAYIARGGDLLAEAFIRIGSPLSITPNVSLWWGHLAFTALFGVLLYWGSERFVGRVNSVLLAIVIAAFIGLLVLTASSLDPSRWLNQNWAEVSGAIPVVVVAFVYHNVVPVITTQLEGDAQRVRWAIVLGALVPLLMFVAWNAVILGCVDLSGVEVLGVEVLDADLLGTAGGVEGNVLDPIELLRQGRSHPGLGRVISVFSEFAIATSFIGFVYGLLNVFSDIESFGARNLTEDIKPSSVDPSESLSTEKPKDKKFRRYALVLMPPLAMSVASPDIFFSAIDFAGAFGNSILFGIIPAVMIWKMRPQTDSSSTALVPGGRLMLSVMIGLAVTVIVQNALIKIGLL